MLADMPFTLTLLVTAFLAPSSPIPAPVAELNAGPTRAVVHCQVPCGIYGDHLRIEMLREHAATIEKAMGQIDELGSAKEPNWNQLVRWVQTKEEHAQAIQDQVSAYWLAQRVKEPEMNGARGREAAAVQRYVEQLVTLHRLTTAAMRCKQTTDVANVNTLRNEIGGFKASYFTEEDKKHLEEHGEHAHEDDKSPTGLERARQNVAITDILRINDATLEFYMDNQRYPKGPMELVTKGANGMSYIDGDAAPKDPWGNAYVLEATDDGDMVVKSLGADGKVGGTGADADIVHADIVAGKWKRDR